MSHAMQTADHVAPSMSRDRQQSLAFQIGALDPECLTVCLTWRHELVS